MPTAAVAGDPPQVALVTGAGVRVGEAIARHLARARLRRGGPLPRAPAARLRGRAPGRPGRARTARTRWPRAFRARFSRLDLLVNSAAGFEARPLEDTDAAAFDAQLDLNARAPLLLTRALLPLLRRARGSVVNVADVGGGLVAWSGFAAYAASKAALVRLTECLALELAPRGPGQRRGAGHGPLAERPTAPPGGASWPAASRWAGPARPLDVAEAVRYLAEAPFVTGAVLPVDGGRRLTGRAGG